MLDLRFVRENPETVRRAMRAKMMEADLPRLENLLRLDEEHRLVRSDLEEKQARRNADSRLVGEMKRRGEDDPELMARLSELSGEVKRLEETERSLEQQIGQLMLAIPNIPHEGVPFGQSAHDNGVDQAGGEKPAVACEPRRHGGLL